MTTSILNSKRTLSVVFTGILLLCSSLSLFAQRSDFSGTWIINIKKTEFGDVPASAVSTQLRVNQKKDSIIIERVGENTFFQAFNFDGSPTETKMPGNKKRVASISWLENGQILVEKTQTIYDGAQQKTITTYNWKLSENGKMLNLTIDFENSSGKYTVKAVYDRK